MVYCCENPEVPDLRHSVGSALMVGFSRLKVRVFSSSLVLYLEVREDSLGHVPSAENPNPPWKILWFCKLAFLTKLWFLDNVFPSKCLPLLCFIAPWRQMRQRKGTWFVADQGRDRGSVIVLIFLSQLQQCPSVNPKVVTDSPDPFRPVCVLKKCCEALSFLENPARWCCQCGTGYSEHQLSDSVTSSLFPLKYCLIYPVLWTPIARG